MSVFSRRRTHAVVAAAILMPTWFGLAGCARSGSEPLHVSAAAVVATATNSPAQQAAAPQPTTAVSTSARLPAPTPPTPSSPATKHAAAAPAPVPTAAASTAAPPASADKLADPAHIQAAVWLPTGQLPMDPTYHWSWSPVPNPPFAGFTCGTQTLDQLGATSAAMQSATAAATAANQNTFVADQRLYFFPNRAAAERAMHAITSDIAACKVSGPVPTPGTHQTAAATGAVAVATYPTPNPANSYGALRETHSYLVQHGPVIAIVTLTTGTADGTPNADYLATVQDPSVLAALSDHLAVYGTA